MGIDWARYIPDFEGLARRFPVSLVLLVLATAIMLAFADGDILGPVRNWNMPVPIVREVFGFSLAAILSALALDLYGERRGWSNARQNLAGLIAALLLLALVVLPAFLPTVAVWLPVNPWLVAWGSGLIALAAMAGQAQGEEANRRILTAVLGVFAANFIVSLFMWILQLPFTNQPNRVPPVGQVFMAGLIILLCLGWLSRRRRDDEIPAGSAAQTGWTALHWLVLPLLILFAMGSVGVPFRVYVSGGSWPTIQNVPQLVEPFAKALVALTAGYLFAYPRREHDAFARWFTYLWPVLAVLAAAGVVAGFVREMEAARQGMPRVEDWAQPLGAAHIADQVGLWAFGALALLIGLLAIVLPSRRDMRLPLRLGGWLLLVFGVGPASLDRLTSWRMAPEIPAYLTAKAFLVEGRLKPATEARWQPVDANRLSSMLGRLTDSDSLGVLEPVFRGSTDNPFTGAPKSTVTLAADVYRRLGLNPPQLSRLVVPPPPPSVTLPTASPPQLLSYGFQAASGAIAHGGFDTLIGPLNINLNVPRPGQPIGGNVQRIPIAQAEGINAAEGIFDVQTDLAADGDLRLRFWHTRSEARFDLAPLLKQQRDLAIERREAAIERQRNLNLPQTPPVPPFVQPPPAQPRIVASTAAGSTTGGLPARLVITVLRANASNEQVQSLSVTAWLQVNRADLEKR
jgi:hypothetical protein